MNELLVEVCLSQIKTFSTYTVEKSERLYAPQHEMFALKGQHTLTQRIALENKKNT